MIKHPNCTTRTKPSKCDDLYCPIHGRIRDMDGGASPWANPDEITAQEASRLGLSEADVLAAYKAADEAGDPAGTAFSRYMHRTAQAADARGQTKPPPQSTEEVLDSAFDDLKQAAEATPDCTCDYMMSDESPTPTRVFNANCPVHGATDTKLQDRYAPPEA